MSHYISLVKAEYAECDYCLKLKQTIHGCCDECQEMIDRYCDENHGE